MKVKSYLNSKGTSFSNTKEFMFDDLYKKLTDFPLLKEINFFLEFILIASFRCSPATYDFLKVSPLETQ